MATGKVDGLQAVNVTYPEGVTYVSGGVYKIGSIVIVAVRLNITALPSNNSIATGLPTPHQDGSYAQPYVRAVTINGNIAIDNNGQILLYNGATGTIIINCTYIAKN